MQEDVRVIIAGLNHNTWLVDFLHNNENAHPILDQLIERRLKNTGKA
jgi:alpha-galactosidase/6-phospho-beta-glucosidase family protein